MNSHAGFLLDVSNLDSGFGTFGENTAVDERLTLVVGSFLGASIHSCLAFDVRLKSIRNGRNMNETVMRMKVYFLTTLTMSWFHPVQRRHRTRGETFFLATPQKRTLQFFRSKMFEVPNNSTLPTCGHQRHTKTKLQGSWQSGWAFMPWRSGARKVFLEMVIRSAVWERSTNLGNIWKDYIDI